MSGSASRDGDRGSRRRRHRSRSRREGGRRRRKSEHGTVKTEPAPELPPQWGPGGRPSGPPAGWHGSASGGPPPPGNPSYPVQSSPADYGTQPMLGGPPGGPPPFGHPGPPHPGMPLDAYSRPPPHLEVRYESVREDPYAPRFGAVPPPADLDAGYRKGGKGKGKFGSPFFEQEGVDSRPPDGLMISNVPTELTTLDVLNRHFRQFGEVLKITTYASEGRAFIQFAERASAEAAASAPVLARPEITVAWSQRKGKGKGKGKDRPTHLDRPAENRVLCADPEEQRRMDAGKRKRDEIASRRNALLANLTEQLKKIMTMLNAEDVPEAKQEAYRGMIMQIKAKMDALSAQEVPTLEEAPAGKGVGDGKGGKRSKGDKGDAGRYTLDLRPKVMRVTLSQSCPQDKLREELAKLGATEEKIFGVQAEEPADAEQPAGAETVLVYFKDCHSAEHIFKQRGELPCAVEWCEKPPPLTSPSPAAIAAAASGVSPQADAPPASDGPAIEAKTEDVPVESAEPATTAEVAATSVEALAETVVPESGAAEVAAEAASAAVPEASGEQALPNGEAEAATAEAAAPEAKAAADNTNVAAAPENAEAESTANYRVDLSEEEADS